MIPKSKWWFIVLLTLVWVGSANAVSFAGECLTPRTTQLAYTDILEAHLTDGMTTVVGYNTSTGTTIQIGYQQTWPTVGSQTTVGWQTQWGNSTYATLTLPYSAVVKTYLSWTKDHYKHYEPYQSPSPTGLATMSSIQPDVSPCDGTLTYEYDKVYVSGAPAYPLLVDYSVRGDDASYSLLQPHAGTKWDQYGLIIEAQANSTWGQSYSSGHSLGVAVNVFGFSLDGTMSLSMGYSISHSFGPVHSRYLGYDRNTNRQMWYFTHN